MNLQDSFFTVINYLQYELIRILSNLDKNYRAIDLAKVKLLFK